MQVGQGRIVLRARRRRGVKLEPMPTYYKVLYDFEAKGAVELDVPKDSYVVGIETDDMDEAEGWLQAETLTDKRSGFVPREYVVEVPAAEAGAVQPPAHTAAEQSFEEQKGNGSFDEIQMGQLGAMDAGLGLAREQTVAQATAHSTVEETAMTTITKTTTMQLHRDAARLDQTQGFDVQRGAASPSPDVGAAALQDAPATQPKREGSSVAPSYTGSIVESFMKNEVYFRSLMKQRQETFMRLDGCINDTATEVAACKQKNAVLAKKIRELDNMIEEDRAKWRGRVDEERKLLLSQTSSFNAPAQHF
eukprot:TRINITY_DN6777_c0_g1_i1.p1 TRINITY_DN6777_c0_g1~~TRINITY_DN6777_c0_g1_i1.p1  ORF type:complete len:306 (+),score=111.05 TRINITY_DN6777_c0_g1_i1:930-1847(+)